MERAGREGGLDKKPFLSLARKKTKNDFEIALLKKKIGKSEILHIPILTSYLVFNPQEPALNRAVEKCEYFCSSIHLIVNCFDKWRANDKNPKFQETHTVMIVA